MRRVLLVIVILFILGCEYDFEDCYLKYTLRNGTVATYSNVSVNFYDPPPTVGEFSVERPPYLSIYSSGTNVGNVYLKDIVEIYIKTNGGKEQVQKVSF